MSHSADDRDDDEKSLSDAATFAGAKARPVSDDKSLGDAATYAGAKARPARDDKSLGDERTVGGADAAGFDTVFESLEVVDLAARYTVEGPLGQGGMGAVLLATDTRLDRKVAIKRILGAAAGNRVAVARFLTEAKAIAALNHPNIVQIYDYGRAKDGPFLIMEYVDGGSLLEKCQGGPLDLEAAVDIACQICDGLAKAHDAGIVHRDIKPANVLLNRDGLPKLTDFGLAKAEAADHGMTMTGAVMGTPDFMPPEQRRDAAEVDHRSDLWSLAATVYQMVTGRSPKIIRFNDIPVALQGVLGKALEDRKDARYQSARELRDALKTSMRAAVAAAAAPVAAGEVGEGTCAACGVKNDPNRKFCKGCGESLLAPCLACDAAIPIWDEICGSCGGKQTPLLDERRRAMAAKQAEAEGFLGDLAFDGATAIAMRLRDEPHPKLRHLSGWATGFLEQIEKARAAQIQEAVETIREAQKHEEAYDYLSAVFALDTVPESLRDDVLPGTRESVARMIARIKKTQAEIRRLETLVKERVAARQLDELLPDVEKLLALRPDREDVRKIRGQLLDRQQKQSVARDEAVATARAQLAGHDYEGAFASLSGVAAAAVTAEVIKLRDEAEGLVRQVRTLSRRIKEAVAGKQLDGLLEPVEAYLRLKPADAEVARLRQSLVAREEKISAEILARLAQAGELEQACRFAEAATLLGAIPEARRSEAVVERLDRVNRLGPQRQAAMTALAAAKGATYDSRIAFSQEYRAALEGAQLVDAEFAALLQRTEAARDQAARSRRIMFVTGAVAAGIAAVVAIVAAGLWFRSSARAAALASAIAQSRWDDALAIEPENAAALVGRARKKLAASPPDVAGAFLDLDRAERSGERSPAVERVRGDGLARRSQAQAQDDRLDVAAQDLGEARRLGGSASLVEAAQESLVAGWVARAQAASDRGDVPRLQKAVAAALGVGGSPDRLLAVWKTYAVGRIAAFDIPGLKLACVESEKLGLPGETQAGWWLEIANMATQPPREDTAVLQTALKAAKAAGASNERLLAVWKTYAVGRIAAFDIPGLKLACVQSEKLGLPGETQAGWWLEIAAIAAQPPREDTKVLRTALEAASVAGAANETVAPLQARGLLLEAAALVTSGDMRSAVAKAIEATLLDLTGSVTALKLPANQALRAAVVADYRGQFDAGLAGGDWDRVLRIAAAAGAIDVSAAGWVGAAIANHPGGLSALPPEVLGTLPATVVGGLPPAMITALPAGTLAALPAGTLAALPPAVIAALPPLRNTIGINLKLIPAGRFTMGEAGGGSDETPHEVTLTKAFYIGVHEVTNAQWQRVMGSVPSSWKDADRPVEQVSWDDAVEFCRKLSALPEERRAGRAYRLPTEAEWEYACRAGSKTRYCFGDDESLLGDYAWFDGNSGSQTHPVGQKKPNAWGLFDMHGSVWEWCSDGYGNYGRGAVTDPQGPSGASGRVSRGGCWGSTAWGCRSADRSGVAPSFRGSPLGFRLALSPSGAQPVPPEAGTGK